ncbi:MAG: 60S ribosomal export protein NMD3 [Candidatus Diapherotrites archaeon]
MEEFCPKCGSIKGPFLGGFCKACYLEDHEIIVLPETIEIEKCARCGRIRLSGQWVEDNNALIAEFLDKKTKIKDMDDAIVSVDFEESLKVDRIAIVKAQGEISGVHAEVARKILLAFKRVACPSCGKISGGYFEAKIQIRWNGKRNLKKEKSLCSEMKRLLFAMSQTDPLAIVTDESEAQNGCDLYIGSNKAAKAVLSMLKNRFDATVHSSAKLSGFTKSGKERYKITYSVRLKGEK